MDARAQKSSGRRSADPTCMTELFGGCLSDPVSKLDPVGLGG